MSKPIELTGFGNVLVPALPVAENLKGEARRSLHIDYNCTHAEFLGAVEALREAGYDVKVRWGLVDSDVTAQYAAVAVNARKAGIESIDVYLTGPTLEPDEEPPKPDAEIRLRELAGLDA